MIAREGALRIMSQREAIGRQKVAKAAAAPLIRRKSKNRSPSKTPNRRPKKEKRLQKRKRKHGQGLRLASIWNLSFPSIKKQ